MPFPPGFSPRYRFRATGLYSRSSVSRSTRHNMFPVLRQVVRDREPRCLGADKDVGGRADRGIVDQRPHGDMNESAFAHHRIEQRAAFAAMRVVAVLVAVDHETVLAFGDAEFVARDAGERLERRTGRAPAIRAMAVQGVTEFVSYGVADRAAIAFSGKN